MNDINTDRFDYDAQTNPEVQEALSNRYSTAAIVTPLRNGKFAVFANDRTVDSLIICSGDSLPIVVASRSQLAPRKTNVPKQALIDPEKAAKIDFSDL